MDTLLTTVALLLPVLLGGCWMNLLVPPHCTARTVLVWSHGAFLGLLFIPLCMWGLNKLGIPLSFFTTAAVGGVLIAVALVARYRNQASVHAAPRPALVVSGIPTPQRVLLLFLLLLLVVRLATLGMEILWRPLFPWDATMHWATKAKVWFEYRNMVPFVDNGVWLNMGGEGVFTDRHPEYPATIPLLQVWMNLATGQWNNSLMNLPWLVCLVALGGMFYSQLRVAGVVPVIAIAGTYLLLSMPLVDIHVALAGYADLYLGAAYCGAIMAFYNWRASAQRWQALLAICFALTCPLIKNEGLLWLTTFVPALVFIVVTRHKLVKLLVLLLLGLGLLAVLMYRNPIIVTQILHQITQFHPDGLTGMIISIWVHDNWHLFGYLLLAMVPVGALLPGARTRAHLGIGIALGCAVLLFLFLFLFTEFGEGASNFTGVGRLSIQLIPGLAFLTMLLVNELLTRSNTNILAALLGRRRRGR